MTVREILSLITIGIGIGIAAFCIFLKVYNVQGYEKIYLRYFCLLFNPFIFHYKINNEQRNKCNLFR